MDYLFSRISPYIQDHGYAWILWYLWKGRNGKVFNGVDRDPMETLKMAEIESILWNEAQMAAPKVVAQSVPSQHRQDFTHQSICKEGRW